MAKKVKKDPYAPIALTLTQDIVKTSIAELEKGRSAIGMLEQMGLLSPEEAKGMRECSDKEIAAAKKHLK